MEKYLNISGNSGVEAYEIGDDFICVKFHDHSYVYTNDSAGVDNIIQMKQLAQRGLGLSTYISRYVRDKYATKD